MKDRQQCPECKAWHWKRPSGVCAKCEQRRGNPSGVVAEIPGRIEAIDYLRPKNASPAPDRKGVRGNFVPYRHAFRSSAKMLALADGSVLITPSKGGRRLWTPAGPKGWAR